MKIFITSGPSFLYYVWDMQLTFVILNDISNHPILEYKLDILSYFSLDLNFCYLELLAVQLSWDQTVYFEISVF